MSTASLINALSRDREERVQKHQTYHGFYGSTSCCISHGPCQWVRVIFYLKNTSITIYEHNIDSSALFPMSSRPTSNDQVLLLESEHACGDT